MHHAGRTADLLLGKRHHAGIIKDSGRICSSANTQCWHQHRELICSSANIQCWHQHRERICSSANTQCRHQHRQRSCSSANGTVLASTQTADLQLSKYTDSGSASQQIHSAGISTDSDRICISANTQCWHQHRQRPVLQLSKRTLQNTYHIV